MIELSVRRSDAGGDRPAAIYSLLGTAKPNGHNPEAFLREVLARIAEHIRSLGSTSYCHGICPRRKPKRSPVPTRRKSLRRGPDRLAARSLFAVKSAFTGRLRYGSTRPIPDVRMSSVRCGGTVGDVLPAKSNVA
jgi:hypothetical protein